jgi:hypothetical protein
MSCSLQQIVCQRLDSPENRQILEDLLIRYQDDPQYFFYLKASLQLSLPEALGFDERIVRMTCDRCALNPLEECKLVDVLVAALQARSTDGHDM